VSGPLPAVPRATVRLQLHKGFTFADAEEALPYLASLGVSHIYSSPILTARPGSIHGYDVIDPTQVNPELGGEEGLRRFVTALRGFGLGLIVDIVPNHMAVGASENPWWADVLRHGRHSRYAEFFDIDWDSTQAGLRGRVLAPFLGKAYGEALMDGELRLRSAKDDGYVIDYFGNKFPIRRDDEAHVQEAGLESFNAATQSGRDMLHALLERQHYRLAWWRTAGDEINWRRFFDINGLAGLRAEHEAVFEAAHATLFRLYVAGLIDGFRIDHVDGLTDPPAYCRRLRRRLHELESQRPTGVPDGPAYLVVEKIIAHGETLPADWQVAGTTGYDFMNEVNALQHDQSAAQALGDIWHTFTGRTAIFAVEEHAARLEVLARSFEAPLQSVVRALHDLAWGGLATRDLSPGAIRRGVTTYLSHFPVYRAYNNGGAASAGDRASFSAALVAARQDAPLPEHAILEQIDRWLSGEAGGNGADALRQRAATVFNQLSAPLAAKAVEDTAFYRYGPLLSRNDVGFDAGRLGSSVDDFHAACLKRLRSFPDAMLATATHDHKRGEDVRARLAVISERPEAWREFASRMLALPASVRPAPDDEIMLYQTLIGAWPFDLGVDDAAASRDFAERLVGWQQKALREAKLRTDWVLPNDAYEQQARAFLFDAMSSGSQRFLYLHSFARRLAAPGAVNGLVQATLKLMAPGMPDFFQGTEFWDLSLVDPDNRRPVDFAARKIAQGTMAAPPDAARGWRDGRVKQSLIAVLLSLRSQMPELFARGEYLPLTVVGALADHVVAFARRLESAVVVVVAPRLPTALMQGDDSIMLHRDRLDGLSVAVPPELAGRGYTNVLSSNVVLTLGASQPVAPLLGNFPIAVLRSD